MPQVHFIGPSEKKVTNKENTATGSFKDMQIKITEINEFPLRITIENRTHSWIWKWPHSNTCWDMVVAPAGEQAYILSFAIDSQNEKKYTPFLQDNFVPFHVTIIYQDEHEEILTTQDGRPDLTRISIVEYLKNKLPIWPPAVPPEMICEETEESKLERAQLILEDTFDSEDFFKSIKFLDFGCGDGHLLKLVAKTTELAVGYDISPPKFHSSPNDRLYFTADFETVKQHAPYDVILLYDVLEHCEDMEKTLRQVRELCKVNTSIMCKCHPWTGRHGGHQYNLINKAFIHRLLTNEELEEMGYKLPRLQKVDDPVRTYRNLFLKTGFKILDTFVSRDEVEPIFKDDFIFSKFLEPHVAAVSYIDYTLKPI
jgi:SAM-dependent methyltransferase